MCVRGDLWYNGRTDVLRHDISADLFVRKLVLIREPASCHAERSEASVTYCNKKDMLMEPIIRELIFPSSHNG